MKRHGVKYERVIAKIEHVLKTSSLFVLKRLETRTYRHAEYDLHYVTMKRRITRRPHVVILGTLHGEEPAGAVALSEYLNEILAVARKKNVNVTIIPCGNPYGLDRNVRNAPGVRYMNGGFVHPKIVTLAKGSGSLKRFLKNSHATHYLDLHEDYESKGAYVYAFNDQAIARRLLRAATRHIPIERTPVMDDRDIKDADIEDGVVFDAHDSSTEDFMSHQPHCRFSGAIETPSTRYPIKTRARAQADAVIELIRIASK